MIEIKFSKMQIIKIAIFERSVPKKGSNLAIISKERKIADQLKYNDIIDTFPNLNAVRLIYNILDSERSVKCIDCNDVCFFFCFVSPFLVIKMSSIFENSIFSDRKVKLVSIFGKIKLKVSSSFRKRYVVDLDFFGPYTSRILLWYAFQFASIVL